MAGGHISRSTYDVFLSFRGEDTRHGFTKDLYDALTQNNIKVFMDGNNLGKGEDIDDVLVKAIEGSKIAIIVFSETYASSTWCLDELLKILECKKRKGQLVIPVFYKVEPTTVRKQRDSYGKAMTIHEDRFEDDIEKVRRWRSALFKAAHISGWEFRFSSGPVRFDPRFPQRFLLLSSTWDTKNKIAGDHLIKDIVKDVSGKLKTLASNGDNRLWFFGDSSKFLELNDGLRCILNAISEKGTFGMRHIVALTDNSKVMAVKRLEKVRISNKDFKSVIEPIGEMYHQNLLKLRAYYWSKEEKLLFYDFKPNRSLHLHLHGNERSIMIMDWEMRLKIAVQTARGITYIHQYHNLPHGNIKSSNIILTDLYGARVSEYCLTPLYDKNDGYCAPEVRRDRVTLESDVYSFGVVLMELVTEKNPTSFKKDKGGLPRWVKSMVERNSIDQVIPNQFDQDSMEMCELLQVAIACTVPNPDERPTMREVTQAIKQLKQSSMKGYLPSMDCNTADNITFNYKRVTYDDRGYPKVHQWKEVKRQEDLSRISMSS